MNDKDDPSTVKTSIDKARLDPASTYATPQDVADDERLTCEQKIEILKSWAYDEQRLAESEAEGMGGGERSIEREVLRVLGELELEGPGGPAAGGPPPAARR
jgi:hypothetical protein